MAKATLRRNDGFDSQSPKLREDVRKLQSLLRKAGYEIGADGLFGQGTEDAVRDFQEKNSLDIDGIAGPATWRALREQAGPDESSEGRHTLAGFRGDLSWVHAREGHAGKAYWPGGASGVTLDPGMDLGHAKAELIEEAYGDLLPSEQMAAVRGALGIKGDDAKAHLDKDPILQDIRITRSQADTVFPFAAIPYWDGIVNRFPSLPDQDTLSSVHTVMLSLSYNRGANNRGLEVLRQPLEAKNWQEVADIIGSMQQDHKLEGIRKRRRMEADLIRSELA